MLIALTELHMIVYLGTISVSFWILCNLSLQMSSLSQQLFDRQPLNLWEVDSPPGFVLLYWVWVIF